ncbi:hypothetical protein R1flu_017919 [Riccia fluitans]|uniref:Uncharacterized protein n=1 Tax=Riccia fluitans TaxID=41844 RepID=A0ABD1ZGP3_9MARC
MEIRSKDQLELIEQIENLTHSGQPTDGITHGTSSLTLAPIATSGGRPGGDGGVPASLRDRPVGGGVGGRIFKAHTSHPHIIHNPF